jgi:uncharacterized protein (DUF1499 family)
LQLTDAGKPCPQYGVLQAPWKNMNIVKWLLMAALVISLVTVGAGQWGLLAGPVPSDLGVRDGKLAAPSKSPNSVSSQADRYPGHPQQAYAQIAPLPYSGDAASAMKKLADTVRQIHGATIVSEQPDYLYVQFRTRWLGFVDDAEFWHEPATQLIQVRSASRLGRSDLGVNRQRIETIRQRLQQP